VAQTFVDDRLSAGARVGFTVCCWEIHVSIEVHEGQAVMQLFVRIARCQVDTDEGGSTVVGKKLNKGGKQKKRKM